MRRAFAVTLALSLVPAAAADGQSAGAAKRKPKRPDLVAAFVGSPPASAARGTSFASSVRVRNRGKATAAASTARFYLSRDAKVGRGDLRLADTRFARLRATRQATKRVRLTVPRFANAATYRLIGCANRPRKLKESSQRNNCRVARRAVRVTRGTLGGPGTGPPPSSVPGGLSISPGTQSFGSVGVGAKSGGVVFTVTNTGSSSTGTLGTSMVGAAAAQFTPTANSCAGSSLSAGGTCSITVVFGPTSTGDRAATLQVSAAPGGTVGSQLSGTGVTPAALAISPATHQFGTVASGSNAQQAFTITNTGQATSGAISTALGGTDASQYSLPADSCNNQTLAGGATCTVTVRFAPNSVGAKSATLTVSSTPGGSVSSTLSGTGTMLSITPASHNFPSTAVGSTSPTQVFTVRNVGTGPFVLTGVIVPAHFSQTANSCTGTLAANNNAPGGTDECTVTVAFAPSSAGAKSGTLEVGSVGGGTGTAALTGTALTAATLTMTPASHNYGTVRVGQTGVHDFTVTNTGQSASGPLGAPVLTGTNPTHFDINAGGAPANACTAGMTLAASASCVVRVTYSPNDPGGGGPHSATIGVTPTSGAGGTASATLAGEGTYLSITPTSATLTPGGTQVFTVTNNGTTMPSAITTSGLSGGDASHFTITNNGCAAGTVLNAGASCTVTVQFSPAAGTSGTRIAVLTVSGPPGYSTQATVSGTS